MNIHEHQAKKILKKYGAPVPEGVHGFSVAEIVDKAKNFGIRVFSEDEWNDFIEE